MTTQNRKLSKTTAVASTSIKKDFTPYWNASCEVINSALLLPHRDRLARFGGEVIQFLVEQNGGEVVVLDKTVFGSLEEELTADLLAILHVFSCRMSGLQRYRDQIKEDRNLSDNRTKTDSL